MLVYYVEWHMRETWRKLMFADEGLKRKTQRDPVAAAERSPAALEKIARRTLADGSPVHSFRTLLHELSTIVRNTCEARAGRRLNVPDDYYAESHSTASASATANNLRVATHPTLRNASTP
jgi:hypothetical protein